MLCVLSAPHVTGYLLITSGSASCNDSLYHPVSAKAVDYICVEIMKLLRTSVISVILVACDGVAIGKS